MLLRLLLLGLGLFVLIRWALPSPSPRTRRFLVRTSTGFAIAAGLVLLVRMGLPWLAVIGTALLAVARFALPLVVRLLPVFMNARMQSRATGIPRPNAGPTGCGRPQDMTREQALEVLELREGASKSEILDAYRNLIKKVHPDRGGSSYLAAQVNRARDVLLGQDAK